MPQHENVSISYMHRLPSETVFTVSPVPHRNSEGILEAASQYT
ncbi:hypothetical protein CHCC20335_0217 [Bacillus paralicheniformis]|nr:hypothetical protein CHCC20335_0217 [Bacillus paralicheniformis]